MNISAFAGIFVYLDGDAQRDWKFYGNLSVVNVGQLIHNGRRTDPKIQATAAWNERAFNINIAKWYFNFKWQRSGWVRWKIDSELAINNHWRMLVKEHHMCIIDSDEFLRIASKLETFMAKSSSLFFPCRELSRERHVSCQTSRFYLTHSKQSQWKRIQISQTFSGCDPPRSQLPLSNVKWSILCHRKKAGGGEATYNKIIMKFTRIDRKPFSYTFHFVVGYRSDIILEYQGLQDFGRLKQIFASRLMEVCLLARSIFVLRFAQFSIFFFSIIIH